MALAGCGSRSELGLSGLRDGDLPGGASGGLSGAGRAGSSAGGNAAGLGGGGGAASGGNGGAAGTDTCDGSGFVARAPELTADATWISRTAIEGVETTVARDVAVAADGTLYVTGQFAGVGSFGHQSLVSAGAQDVFVARFEGLSVRWARSFGTPSTDRGYALAVDGAGNVYIAGETGATGNTVDFGGGAEIVTGSPAMFLASYGPLGEYRWSKQFGGATGSSRAHAVAVDGADNVYLAGYFGGSTDFGAGAADAGSSSDLVIASFDAAGAPRWSRTFGGTDFVRAAALHVAASGNLYVGGWFSGTVDFGGGALSSAGGWADAFLIALDAAGEHRWSKRFGDAGVEVIDGVCSDGAEAVYVTGSDSTPSSFLDSALTVTAFGASGEERWAVELGGTGLNLAYDCVADRRGLVVVGLYEDCIDFGAGPKKPQGFGGFVLGLTQQGAPRWSMLFDDIGADWIEAASPSPDGETLFAAGTLGSYPRDPDDPSSDILDLGSGVAFVASRRIAE